MLPFLEVTHLPASSSFYSAISQPLGLHYLSAEPAPFPAITYGIPHLSTPIFQIRRAATACKSTTDNHPSPNQGGPVRSRIVLTAPSPAAVHQFYASAVRANPRLAEIGNPLRHHHAESASDHTGIGDDRSSVHISDKLAPTPTAVIPGPGGELRARACDFDGNIMEVVYVPPPAYPSSYGGPTVRRTQSTNEEVSRILDWNYGVTTSVVAPSHYSTSRPRGPTTALGVPRHSQVVPASRFLDDDHDDQPYTILRRSVTTTTTSSVYDPAVSPRQNSSGISAGAVVGTLLGAAAGAALTYTMIKNDRARAPLQEFDPPAFQRRATFPDPFPDRRGRFVEVERTVEKIRYPDDYKSMAGRHGLPRVLSRYSQVDGAAPRSREVDDIYDDRRSRHSARYRSGPGSSVRTRSEAPLGREPLLITDTEHRSYMSSKHSAAAAPRSVHRSAFDVPDRESYVSARSHKSSSTIRPGPTPVQSQVVARSKTGSRVTTTTIKLSGNSPSPRVLSRAGSYISAREVPGPPSGVGTGHANREDDVDSIAPSDSISCVGSRRSARSYRG